MIKVKWTLLSPKRHAAFYENLIYIYIERVGKIDTVSFFKRREKIPGATIIIAERKSIARILVSSVEREMRKGGNRAECRRSERTQGIVLFVVLFFFFCSRDIVSLFGEMRRKEYTGEEWKYRF